MSRAPLSLIAKRWRNGVTMGLLFGALGFGAGCVEQQEDKPTAEDLEIVKKSLLSAEPSPEFKTNGDLDGKVVYLGLDSSSNPIEPGKDVRLTHYWKVISAPGAGWRSYTHLNGGPNNAGWMNFDHGPVRGKYPVSQWKTGDIIKDEHTIRLPPTWSFDHLEVYAGLYRGAERMVVKKGPQDAQGRLLAATIPVKVVKANTPAKRYVVRKTLKPLKIDGKLDEQAWTEAPSVGLFVNTLTGVPAPMRTEAKLLWDAQNLYLAFDIQDTDIWTDLSKRDDKLWTEEAIEVMIDADGNGKSYIELQVAPNGNVFDTYLPEYRKYEDSLDPKRKPFDWNSKMKVAVKVEGTLNKRDDKDKGWTVEMAVPLADVNGLATGGVKVPPAYGDIWRLNMYRLDKPKDGQQWAAAWSPPMVPDFHALDRFGEVMFADDKGQVPPAATKPGADPKAIKAMLEGMPKHGVAPGSAEPASGGKVGAARHGRSAGSEAKK